jgi:hypothetical protein
MSSRPDFELPRPGADELGDDLSLTIHSSPNADHFAPYCNEFSLEASQDSFRGDLFGWETALDWTRDQTTSTSFTDSLALSELRPHRRRPKASAKPMVLRLFESCLSVELAVKQLKRAFKPARPA